MTIEREFRGGVRVIKQSSSALSAPLRLTRVVQLVERAPEMLDHIARQQ
jgi:hypothetical protein